MHLSRLPTDLAIAHDMPRLMVARGHLEISPVVIHSLNSTFSEFESGYESVEHTHMPQWHCFCIGN